MKKLYLTTLLVSGLMLSTANAQDYDKKNTANLESNVGFEVLKLDNPISKDNMERDMQMPMPSPVTSSSANSKVMVQGVVKPTMPKISAPTMEQKMVPAQKMVVMPSKAPAPAPVPMTTTIKSNNIAIVEPALPVVKVNPDNTTTVEETEITIIEPVVEMDASVETKAQAEADTEVIIETKKVIGNTDTGATPEAMSKYLEKMN